MHHFAIAHGRCWLLRSMSSYWVCAFYPDAGASIGVLALLRRGNTGAWRSKAAGLTGESLQMSRRSSRTVSTATHNMEHLQAALPLHSGLHGA